MRAPATMPDLDEPPMPTPWRGVRQLAIVVAVAVVMAVLAWILWWRVAIHRYTPKLAELRARGEPILLTEFPRPELSAQDNAALYWNKACTALSATVYCPANSNVTYPDAPPYPKAWMDMAAAAVVANAPAIFLAEQAAAHSRANWGPLPASPYSLNMPMGKFNSMRALADELGDAALYAHLQGDDAEALRRIETLLRESDDVQSQDTALVGYLVSVGIRSLALARLEVIASDLHIAGDGLPGGATRAAVIALMNRINNSSGDADRMAAAIRSERAFSLDMLDWAADHQPILRPMFMLDEANVLDVSAAALDVAAAPSQPAGQGRLRRDSALSNSDSFLMGYLPFYFQGQFRFFEIRWRLTTESRMAAVILALHLFEHDHGTWPTSLAQLTPKYLQSLPADPYAADGRSVGYVLLTAPNSKTLRPMVYCDQTAVASAPPWPSTTPWYGWSQNTGRQWRDVAAWQLPPAERHLKLPSTTSP